MSDNFDDMSDSPYFKADSFPEPRELTIQSFTEIEIQNLQTKKMEKKWTVGFEEDPRRVILNKSRRDVLTELFGKPSTALGKKIVLSRGKTRDPQGKVVGCIDFAAPTAGGA